MVNSEEIRLLLEENETDANRLVGRVLLAESGLFLLAALLFILDVWIEGSIPFAVPMFCGAGISFSGWLCARLGGDGRYVKYTLMSTLLITVLLANMFSGYVLWIAFAIPLLLSIRYFRPHMCVTTGCITAAVMALNEVCAVYVSPLYGHLNANLTFLPAGTVLNITDGTVDNAVIALGFDRLQALGNFFLYEYLPMMFVLVLLTAVCILVTRRCLSMVVKVQEKMDRSAKLERQLLENRSRIMVSQVQPHFIYNTMNTIYYLCENEPERAQEAISVFADYMRDNMDAMQKDEPIPFEDELAHVKSFLWIEQLRYEDRLKVKYNIGPTDFKLPALSVQTLVQNSVKYGIRSRVRGGTITISTAETEKYYEVTVADDGRGFAVSKQKDDGRSHTGIENTRSRLRVMCHGRLEVHSVPEAGSKVTIQIPKDSAAVPAEEEAEE